MVEVCIVGGGIAGLYAAYNLSWRLGLSSKGNVYVFEAKKRIGELYKSSGGIARYWLENPPLSYDKEIWKKTIVDEIREVVIYPPLHSEKYPEVRVSSSEAIGYVIDHRKLEKTLARRIVSKRSKNTEIYTRRRIRNIPSEYDYDYIIGADGAFSVVARDTVGLPDESHMHKCLEYWFPSGDGKHRLEIYFRPYCPKGYIWVFPAKDYVKIGAGIPMSEKAELKEILSRFLNETDYGKLGEPVAEYGGVVPTAKPLKPVQITPQKNIALIGDAGRLVNSATGGGIHLALLSGYHVAKSIAMGGLSYYREWYRDEVYPQLERWYRIRSILVSSTPEELSEIISMVGDFVGEVFTGKPVTLNPIQLLSQAIVKIATHPKTSLKVLAQLFWGID
jgi:flavin-dependent dehydrogenase